MLHKKSTSLKTPLLPAPKRPLPQLFPNRSRANLVALWTRTIQQVAPPKPPKVSLDDQFRLIISAFRNTARVLQSADVRRLRKSVQRRVRESNRKNRRRAARSADGATPSHGFIIRSHLWLSLPFWPPIRTGKLALK